MVFKAEHLERVLRLRQKSEEAAEKIPALLAEAENVVASVLHGEHPQRKSGIGEKFWQFREYTPFDRPQDIDWRQSAKTERVYIRQKEKQTNQTVLIWTSNDPQMHFTSDTTKQTKHRSASVLGLSVALLLTRNGERVGLLGQKRPGSSEITLETIAHDLSDPSAYVPNTYDLQNVHIPQNAGLILLSDFLQPIEDLNITFKALASICDQAYVVQVLDPAELTLPYEGRYIFTDPSSKNENVHIENVGAMRNEYLQRLHEHNQKLKDLCRLYNWGYTLHNTSRPHEETLSNIWADMNINRKGARQVHV